jgi:hypothetical protein
MGAPSSSDLPPTGDGGRLCSKRFRERNDPIIAQANRRRPTDGLLAHRPDLFDRGADVPTEIGINRRAIGVDAQRSVAVSGSVNSTIMVIRVNQRANSRCW